MRWRVREVLRIRLEASTETSGADLEEHDVRDAFPHLVDAGEPLSRWLHPVPGRG